MKLKTTIPVFFSLFGLQSLGLFAAPNPALEIALARRVWQGIPGVERTVQGRLFYTWYTGGELEPRPENMALLCYSGDNGKTHSPLRILGAPRRDGTRAFDPVPWIDPKGRLWYIFNRDNETTGLRGVHARICEAPDAPNPVFGPEFRIGIDVPYSFCMNKPIVLSSGEWVMPLTYQKQVSKTTPRPARFQGIGISSDEGKTWTLRGSVPEAPRGSENMIIELKDGRLWMLWRTGAGCLYESFSPDKGITWSKGAQTTIANPDSRFFIRRLASGNLLLVNHFGNDPKARHSHDRRSHLTAQLSTDDGRTWNTGLLLDERKRISYPDGVQDKDGVIWIIYDRNRRGIIEHNHPEYGHILVAKFREEDVAQGKNVSGAVVLRQVINSITSSGQRAKPGGK